MNTWLADIINALENLGGMAEYSDLYAEIRKLRNIPLPQSWTAIVRRTIEQHSSDSEAFNGKDIFYSVNGIGNGVWGLKDAMSRTPLANDIEELPLPKRALCETYRILRDTAIARAIKLLHKNCCQLCGESLQLPSGKTYSEAHHIKPLGGNHKGPDIAANILVLCPNHHVQCDYGAIELSISKLRIHPKHQIDLEYIEYHNKNIYAH